MRNERRSRQQWLALFKQQQQSGLSAAEFCKAQSIHLQTFYARRSDIRQQSEHHFIKVEREVTTEVVQSSGGPILTLEYGQSRLSLPVQTTPKWLASLLKGLAQ